MSTVPDRSALVRSRTTVTTGAAGSAIKEDCVSVQQKSDSSGMVRPRHRVRSVRRLTAITTALVLAVAGCANAGRDTPSSAAADNSTAPASSTAPAGGTSAGVAAGASDSSAPGSPAGSAAGSVADSTGSVPNAPVGDSLTVAVQAPATGMNPATVNTAFNTYALLAYEPLIYQSQKGLQPALAQKWELTKSNTQLTLTLRSGVSFADGDPVTADAVKKSLEYCKSAGKQQALQTVTAITAPDATHVTLTSSQPNPMFPDFMTQNQGCGMIISPNGLAKADDLTVDNPSAGAGAYVYDPKQSVSGDHYTYTANPTYYDKAKQHYKEVTLRVIANPQAALNALTTGQVDLTVGDFTTANSAKAAGLDVAWTPFVWTGINLIDRAGEVTKPLGDVRVRQAINYAIDRKSIAKALLGEFGTPTDQPAAPGFDMHSKAAEDRYPYDPQKAKDLLKEAGYPNGFELPLLSVKFSGLDILTQALVPQLAAVGITAKVTMTTDEKSYIGGMTNKKYPAVMVGYGSQPSYIMAQGLFAPTALPFNGFGSHDPELDKLIKDLGTAPDTDARTKFAVQIEDWLVDQAWFAPVAFGPVLYYGRTGLGGLSVSGGSPTVSVLDLYNES